jgi:hypothetical protein
LLDDNRQWVAWSVLPVVIVVARLLTSWRSRRLRQRALEPLNEQQGFDWFPALALAVSVLPWLWDDDPPWYPPVVVLIVLGAHGVVFQRRRHGR